jgi:superfamily II DNA or RNA helicase
MIMSGELTDSWSGCQVASIDTFRARVMQREIINWPDARLVVIDEAHRSLSPTYLKVIEHYTQRGAAIIGLTATPIRGDGKGLGHVYSNMVQTPGVPDLIRKGYLVPTKHFAPSVPDLTGVKTKRGDYDEQQLQAAMDRNELVGDIVTNWLRLGKGRQTVVFASGVAHSIHLRDEFLRAGVLAAHIDGKTLDTDRDRIIKDLRAGKIQVICNCMVLTEGFDMPALSCCVLARPTKNYGLYLQMVGRIKRPDKISGKVDSICIDHSGAVYRHGRVDEPYAWSLDVKGIADKETNQQQQMREKTNITCKVCAAVYQGQLVCPECGHVPERTGQFVDSRHGDLVEFDGVIAKPNARNPGRFEQVKWFNMFLRYAEEKGFKRGWAHRKFKDKFHEWPARDFPEFEHVDLEPEFLSYIRYLNIKYGYAMKKERERADING